ncbi:MAG TPA: AtpZ/AtpI family protein [bacterium]|nr:AtpZ/AtpI family protein [bacterium]
MKTEGAPREPRRDTVWERLPQRSAASQGYDMAANVLVGVGLGWLAQHFFPGIRPWGLAAGTVLGAVSGFYQLFKAQGRSKSGKKPGSAGDGSKP